MRSMKKVSWSLFFGLTLLFSAAVLGDDLEDDSVPDVTARVSRISLIRGEVQIRREGSQDWEKATLNLPVVEGDEIMTESGSRVEIQIDLYSHVRVAENSYLKVAGLKDGAVALSISEGTVAVVLTRFDPTASFFEIDAPKTTVALQRSGSYRIDAGNADPGSNSVRVTVTGDGEARVYSDNSGFTLKSERSATLKIDGPLAGEWETLDAGRWADEFDNWVSEREATIAKRIKDAYYDKYYDQDIYGAEDLNDNGEWIYTSKYGHVWRPYSSAIRSYANWSPYRYGHWRWVPPYGWTWVNDEPWAWATYHHGRWFFDNGYWYWSPYGHSRRGRSWWYPALVGVTIINHHVYWYPLPRDFGYFNYNHCFGGWGGPRGPRHNGPRSGGPRNGHQGNNTGNNNGPGGPVVTPTPGYVGPLPGQIGPSVFTSAESRRIWMMTPPLLRVPPGAVVGTSLSSFGREKAGYSAVTAGDARNVLTKRLGDNVPTRILPTYQELDGRVSTLIKSEKPRNPVAPSKPIGAAVRSADGGPMDKVLRETRMLGGRDPVRPEAGEGIQSTEPRKTGAVTRLPIRPEAGDPVRPERNPDGASDPVKPEPRATRPSKERIVREVEPVRPEPTRIEQPRKERVQPRSDPPPTRSEPVRSQPTRSEATRSSPPPSKSESTRSSPPPSKSEPTKSEPSDGKRTRP